MKPRIRMPPRIVFVDGTSPAKRITQTGFKSGSSIVMKEAVRARTFLIPIVYKIEGMPIETVPTRRRKKADFGEGRPLWITKGRQTRAVIRCERAIAPSEVPLQRRIKIVVRA